MVFLSLTRRSLTKLFFLVCCSGKFSIITFEEFIEIALDAPRVVGIYPEIKNPVFINQHVSIWKAVIKNGFAESNWIKGSI